MKKQILKIGIIAFTLIMGVFVWQSCSNDNDNNNLFRILNSEKNTLTTPKYGIQLDKSPQLLEKFSYLKPYNVKNEDELKRLIDKIQNNTRIETLDLPITKRKKSRNLETEVGKDSKFFYSINIICDYKKIFDKIDVTSYITGSMVSWEQKYSSSSWETKSTTNNSVDVYINAEVNGVVSVSVSVAGFGPYIHSFNERGSIQRFIKTINN